MEKNEHGLTDKQEKFAQLYVELGNGSEAYRQSHDTENMKAETIHNETYVLKNKKIVADRILSIRKELASQFLKTKEELMKDLIDILDMTKFSEKEKNTAIKAIEVLNKMNGFNDPEQVEVKQDINIGFGGMENLEIDNGEDNNQED